MRYHAGERYGGGQGNASAANFRLDPQQMQVAHHAAGQEAFGDQRRVGPHRRCNRALVSGREQAFQPAQLTRPRMQGRRRNAQCRQDKKDGKQHMHQRRSFRRSVLSSERRLSRSM